MGRRDGERPDPAEEGGLAQPPVPGRAQPGRAAALFGLALYFAYLAVRPDLDLARLGAKDDPGRARWRERLTAGLAGSGGRGGEELAPDADASRRSSCAVYAVVMSVFTFDWAMSLEPHWYSTLFGGWFFMGGVLGRHRGDGLHDVPPDPAHPDFRTSMGLQQRHDLGKLAFGFTVFWTYLFWSQYIVIWYGKLPWEQAWMVRRAGAPWGATVRAHDRALLRDPVRGAARASARS